MEKEKTFLINVVDNEANFIEVGGDHHAFALFPSFDRNDIAHVVDAHFIGQIFEFFQHQLADAVFKTRGTGGFTNALKQLNVNHSNVCVILSIQCDGIENKFSIQ